MRRRVTDAQLAEYAGRLADWPLAGGHHLSDGEIVTPFDVATDLAAALAEVERLRAALYQIAKESPRARPHSLRRAAAKALSGHKPKIVASMEHRIAELEAHP